MPIPAASMYQRPENARPPFVRFEEREFGINVEATKAAGRPVPRVVDMACITSIGSKDIHERIATEWLEDLKRKALAGQVPTEWYNHFELYYTEWKKGNELPREGTPIKTWPALAKEQALRLLAFNVTTVEDLAQYPDGSLGQIGPDGRYLRDLAKSWLAEAKDKGINAREVADLKQRCADLEELVGSLRERYAALEQQLAERPKPPLKMPKARGLMDTEAG